MEIIIMIKKELYLIEMSESILEWELYYKN